MTAASSKLIYSFKNIGRNIGIFGGSFDPVHIAHLKLAKLAINSLKIDSIIFVPTNKNPLKENSPNASNQDRIEMLALALKEESNFYISDLECLSSDPSYTIDSLRKYKTDFCTPNQKLYFLFGADQLLKFHLWKEYQELFKIVELVPFGRAGINSNNFQSINSHLSLEQLKKLESNFLDLEINISSTRIRELLQAGNKEEARVFLAPDVFEYIVNSRIYA